MPGQPVQTVPGIGQKGVALRQQIPLAQQATGAGGEAGVEEVFDQTIRLQAGQAVTCLHPVLGAQVFQLQQQRGQGRPLAVAYSRD